MKERLILTGFMGAGKSSIGRRLASRLGYLFLDTDALIEESQSRSILDIFKVEGEAAFRDMEFEVFSEVLKQSKVVLSTGGGTLVREEALGLALKKGWVIYLYAPPEVLFRRVDQSYKARPLLESRNPWKDFMTRFEAREPFYQRAHQTVETHNNNVDQVVSSILESL